MKATNTKTAVRTVSRQPHLRAALNRENTKYVKNGLEGPSVKYWNTEATAMSTTWSGLGRPR